jgi:hypothetical protein
MIGIEMSVQTADFKPDAFVMPISNVLHRIGLELADISRWLIHMQTIVSPLVSDTTSCDTVHQIQNLDHMSQKLTALADFLSALAPETPAHWELDPTAATRVVTLSDLTSRLLAIAEEPVTEVVSGECELF